MPAAQVDQTNGKLLQLTSSSPTVWVSRCNLPRLLFPEKELPPQPAAISRPAATSAIQVLTK